MAVSKEERERLVKCFQDIIIIPIDIKKMEIEIDAKIREEAVKAGQSQFAPQIEEGEKMVLKPGGIGLIKGTDLVIDMECIGSSTDDEGRIELEVYVEKYEDGKQTGFSLFPKFLVNPLLSEALEEYALPEISLVEFMGSRFAYNPRIVSNMKMIKGEIALYCENKKELS